MNIPCVQYRGGTSKGLFFLDGDLPQDVQARYALFARALGSPDPFDRQTDGLGGATSSTSKVVVVKRSESAEHEVDYWFGQVDVKTGRIDASGNCGNLSAAVGPFAIHSGLVKALAPMSSVRIRQMNIGQTIVAQVPCDEHGVVEQGDFAEDGVPFLGARIRLEFMEPAQAAWPLLPTGKAQDLLELPDGREVYATLITAGNPTVIIAAHSLGLSGVELPEHIHSNAPLMNTLEHLRCAGAMKMGIAKTMHEAQHERPAFPKIAWIAPARDNATHAGTVIPAANMHMVARLLSMGKLHHAFTGTGAIALACAAAIPGTVVQQALGQAMPAELRLGHASGVLSLAAQVQRDENGAWHMSSTSLARSARRLFSGTLYVPD
jgi:2-methylaconitate isomerase